MTDDETEVRRDLEAQMHLAMEGLQKAVTEVVRKAGRSHYELLRVELLPVVGNA